MAKTLHELANSLQESIIKQQEDRHNSSTLNISRYNNLKLKMDSTIHFPHVIVTIGISEAVFNIKEGLKADGGLGPDERYVKKWMNHYSVAFDLNECYKNFGQLVQKRIEELNNNPNAYLLKIGEAEELDMEAVRIELAENGENIAIEDDLASKLRKKKDGLELELEAGVYREGRSKLKYSDRHSLEDIEDLKNDLKTFLSSPRRFKQK